MQIKKMLKAIPEEINYNIELYTQITLAIVAGWAYGIIEVFWIDTANLSGTKLFGFWHYYHIWMMVVLATPSLFLGISHLVYIIKHQKKYILIMVFAGICLAALVEDISWYTSSWQPILRTDWTMMKPGLGLNVGFTWIPLWYFVTLTVVVALYWWSNRLANIGYDAYRTRERLMKL